jgi:segregation and condensation protein B
VRLPDTEDKGDAKRIAKEEKDKRIVIQPEVKDSDVSDEDEDDDEDMEDDMEGSEEGEDEIEDDEENLSFDEEGSEGDEGSEGEDGSDADDDDDDDEPSADDDSDAEKKKKKKKKKNNSFEIKELPPDPYLIRREATLLNLVLKSFKKRVIVFFNEKVQCHRMLLLFKIFKLNAVEVNGNLT